MRDGGWSEAAASSAPSSQGAGDLKEILEELQDPLLPVRAHGLMELRRLVLNQHAAVSQNLPYILGLFSSQLTDEVVSDEKWVGDMYSLSLSPLGRTLIYTSRPSMA